MQCISHTVTRGHRRVTGSHKRSLVFFHSGYERSSELLSSSNLSCMLRLLRPRAEVSSRSSWASQPGGQTLSSPSLSSCCCGLRTLSCSHPQPQAPQVGRSTPLKGLRLWILSRARATLHKVEAVTQAGQAERQRSPRL